MSKIKIELELSIDDSLELIKFLKKKNIGYVDVCNKGCYATISGLGGIILASGSNTASITSENPPTNPGGTGNTGN